MRRLASFISTFIDETASLGSPKVFRKWTAISLIAATLEQKVWVRTSHNLFPNLYVFLIAHPGVGKTRIINQAKFLSSQLPDPHIAPVSMTFASLVDALLDAKRSIIRKPEGEIGYNSMYITADEMGAFIHKYDQEMIDGLSAFYDPTPYQQRRRTNDIKIAIDSPQINMLAGSTPQNLMGFMPDKAWGQGFTSRIILVFSDERIVVDDFADHGPPKTADLIADLKHISNLFGRFTITEAYRAAVNNWKALGEPPTPSHPRLIHYITRRRVHLYKLSMVASVDRGDDMTLTEDDFLTAIGWLVEAETVMEDVFKAGATNADAAAMDEIQHFVRINDSGMGVSEYRIVNFARERIPLTSITRIIEIMEKTGQLIAAGLDKRTNVRWFKAAPVSLSSALPPAIGPSSGSGKGTALQ